MDFGKKKGMSDLEKKAKLTALKGAHKMASDSMTDAMKSKSYPDSPELKKHVSSMSDDTGIDFKDDSDHIEDPGRYGAVIGRHISDENIASRDTPSEPYDIEELDARIKRLQDLKSKPMKG